MVNNNESKPLEKILNKCFRCKWGRKRGRKRKHKEEPDVFGGSSNPEDPHQRPDVTMKQARSSLLQDCSESNPDSTFKGR